MESYRLEAGKLLVDLEAAAHVHPVFVSFVCTRRLTYTIEFAGEWILELLAMQVDQQEAASPR